MEVHSRGTSFKSKKGHGNAVGTTPIPPLCGKVVSSEKGTLHPTGFSLRPRGNNSK